MKKTIVLIILFVLWISLTGCERIFGPADQVVGDENPTNLDKPNAAQSYPIESNLTTQDSSSSETKKDGYWERYDTQIVVPKDEKVGNEVEFTEYEFFSSETSIGLSTDSTWPAIGDLPAGSELIKTSGIWTIPEEEYFAGQTIRITLTANIDEFKRGRTNVIGVNVWAYLGKENTPLGAPTNQVLRDNQGKGTCSASINDGKIVVDQATKEVSISAPKGSANEKLVILIVVSNQGRQGGVKYFYEWKDW